MKVNTYKKIRKAMVSWERSVLTEIKRENRKGRGYDIPMMMSDLRFYKAMDRLKVKGLVLHVRAPRRSLFPIGHFGYLPRHGYWATALLPSWKRACVNLNNKG